MGICTSRHEDDVQEGREAREQASRRRREQRRLSDQRRESPGRDSRTSRLSRQETRQNRTRGSPQRQRVSTTNRDTGRGGPAVGNNKPLLPLVDYEEWSSPDGPITREELQRQRNEFWDTQPKFAGLEVYPCVRVFNLRRR